MLILARVSINFDHACRYNFFLFFFSRLLQIASSRDGCPCQSEMATFVLELIEKIKIKDALSLCPGVTYPRKHAYFPYNQIHFHRGIVSFLNLFLKHLSISIQNFLKILLTEDFVLRVSTLIKTFILLIL